MERYKLIVDDFTIILELKPVRTLRLRVRPEATYLSAPFYTPRERLCAFVRENAEWLRRARMEVDSSPGHQPVSQEEVEAFVESFKPRFERWQKAMGLHVRDVTFKFMTSRWGSCNHLTRKISINVRLCRYPAECTDYVIVHELAHLVHPDHSPAFWHLVETHFPAWRPVRRLLREPR